MCAVGLVHSMFPLWADGFQQCVQYLTDPDKGWLISICLNIINAAKLNSDASALTFKKQCECVSKNNRCSAFTEIRANSQE